MPGILREPESEPEPESEKPVISSYDNIPVSLPFLLPCSSRNTSLSMHGIQHGYGGRPYLLTTSDDDMIGFLPFYLL